MKKKENILFGNKRLNMLVLFLRHSQDRINLKINIRDKDKKK